MVKIMISMFFEKFNVFYKSENFLKITITGFVFIPLVLTIYEILANLSYRFYDTGRYKLASLFDFLRIIIFLSFYIFEIRYLGWL